MHPEILIPLEKSSCGDTPRAKPTKSQRRPFTGRGCAKSRLDGRRKLKLQQSREQSFVRTCLDEDRAQRVASIIMDGMFLD